MTRALFLGGPQHGVLLMLPQAAPYYDFPIAPKLKMELRRDIPDTICNVDVARYKCTMMSTDGEQAIYTETGDAISALTRVRDFVVEADPGRLLRTGRTPQPVQCFPRPAVEGK